MWGKNNVGQHTFTCDANPNLKLHQKKKICDLKNVGHHNVGLHNLVHDKKSKQNITLELKGTNHVTLRNTGQQ